MKKQYIGIIVSSILFVLCILIHVLVTAVDVKAIGPDFSTIGLATMNGGFKDFIGVNDSWYTASTILGYILFIVPISFVIIFFYQWITRKKFMLIDSELTILFITYGVVVAIYMVYEFIGVNYRPILVNGELVPSFPSSHTMFAVTIAGTSLSELKKLIPNKKIRTLVYGFIETMCLFVVIGRTVSGVHWLSDIIAGILFASFFVTLYKTVVLASADAKLIN